METDDYKRGYAQGQEDMKDRCRTVAEDHLGEIDSQDNHTQTANAIGFAIDALPIQPAPEPTDLLAECHTAALSEQQVEKVIEQISQRIYRLSAGERADIFTWKQEIRNALLRLARLDLQQTEEILPDDIEESDSYNDDGSYGVRGW